MTGVFPGFSFEVPHAPLYFRQPAFVTLMRGLRDASGGAHGGPHVRIGGFTTDVSAYSGRWSAGTRGAVAAARDEAVLHITTDADVEALASAAEFDGALTVGLNFRQGENPALAAAHLRAVLAALPRRVLHAVELGNEIDRYPAVKFRVGKYRYEQYIAELEAYVAALRAVTAAAAAADGQPEWAVRLSAPSLTQEGRRFLNRLGDFTRRYGRRRRGAPGLVADLNVHSYALLGCHGNELSLPMLLRQEPLQSAPSVVELARAHGMTPIIGEGSSVTCGGRAGISDAYGAALWAVDSWLKLAAGGMARFIMHGGPAYPYTPLELDVSVTAAATGGGKAATSADAGVARRALREAAASQLRLRGRAMAGKQKDKELGGSEGSSVDETSEAHGELDVGSTAAPAATDAFGAEASDAGIADQGDLDSLGVPSTLRPPSAHRLLRRSGAMDGPDASFFGGVLSGGKGYTGRKWRTASLQLQATKRARKRSSVAPPRDDARTDSMSATSAAPPVPPVRVKAMYYAALVTSAALRGSAHPVEFGRFCCSKRSLCRSQRMVSAHAWRDSDSGDLRLLVVNKMLPYFMHSAETPHEVQITPPAGGLRGPRDAAGLALLPIRSALFFLLRGAPGRNASAPWGISWAGSTFDGSMDGHPTTPQAPLLVAPTRGHYHLRVPSACIGMLVLSSKTPEDAWPAAKLERYDIERTPSAYMRAAQRKS